MRPGASIHPKLYFHKESIRRKKNCIDKERLRNDTIASFIGQTQLLIVINIVIQSQSVKYVVSLLMEARFFDILCHDQVIIPFFFLC